MNNQTLCMRVTFPFAHVLYVRKGHIESIQLSLIENGMVGGKGNQNRGCMVSRPSGGSERMHDQNLNRGSRRLTASVLASGLSEPGRASLGSN